MSGRLSLIRPLFQRAIPSTPFEGVLAYKFSTMETLCLHQFKLSGP